MKIPSFKDCRARTA